LNQENVEVIRNIFKWYNVKDISEEEIYKMANKIEKSLDNEIVIKSSFSYYKKYTIFSKKNKTPLFFLKYVREKYFLEVLGLHLTRFFFDPELCCDEYMTGIYEKGHLIKRKIPYILTTYVEGKDISNYKINQFKYDLGRHYYLHQILSLYDVHDRHFIVRKDNNVIRIDFGRSFENLEKEYLGFSDYFKEKNFDSSDETIQKGYNEEKRIIKNNLKKKKNELAKIIRMIKGLKEDYELIFFDPDKFVNRLIDHWSTIGFLNEMEMTKIKWI